MVQQVAEGTHGLMPARFVRGARTSHAAAIYAHLRHELVSLVRHPGEPISDVQIALERGVSRTPVREALLKLADEGLVDIFPQSGMRVSRIPVDLLPEALIIRRALEETTARRAAEQVRSSYVDALRAIVRTQREAMEADDRNAFHEADETFHATIASIAGHPNIWALIQNVKVQVDRYRRLTLPQAGRLGRVIREHTRVVTAMSRRDPDGAASAMGAHLDGLMRDIAATRALNPDYFDGAT